MKKRKKRKTERHQHVRRERAGREKMFPTNLWYEKSWKCQTQVIHFRAYSRNWWAKVCNGAAGLRNKSTGRKRVGTGPWLVSSWTLQDTALIPGMGPVQNCFLQNHWLVQIEKSGFWNFIGDLETVCCKLRNRITKWECQGQINNSWCL